MPLPAPGITRAFSERLIAEEPDSQLARALCATFINEDDDEAKPTDARSEMAGVMAGTYHSLAKLSMSEQQKVEAEYNKLKIAFEKLQKKHGTRLQLQSDGTPPDLTTILQGITSSQQELASKSSTTKGKAKARVRDFCQGIRKHSNALKVLPKDDKYVCLFTGSIMTFVEALGNYNDVQEEVDDLLDTFIDDLDYWRQRLELGGSKRMFTYVAKLYVLYFNFLANIFDKWSASSSSRFWTSLDQTALAAFQKSLIKIDRLQSRLERESRDTRDDHIVRVLNIIRQEFQSFSSDQQRIYFSLGYRERKLLAETESMAIGPSNLLSAASSPGLTLLPNSTILQKVEEETSSFEMEVPETSQVVTQVHIDPSTGLTTLRNALAEHLGGIRKLIEQAKPLEIDRNVHEQIAAFLTAPKDSIIWIVGPYDVPTPSQNTLTAAIITVVAERNGLQCATYFNSVSSLHASYRFTQERLDRLMDMVSSIILQLAAFVPEDHRASLPQLHEHLVALDQRRMPLTEALDFLRPLRAAIPSDVLIVVDCFHIQEDGSDRGHTETLRQVVASLCQLADPSGSAGAATTGESGTSAAEYITKICITTDGNMRALGAMLEKYQIQQVEYVTEADELDCDETEAFG